MIYLYFTFTAGYLLCWLVMRREVKYWKREAANQRESNEALNRLYAETFSDAVDAQDQLEDQKLLFAQHLSQCTDLPDDTPIYEDAEV